VLGISKPVIIGHGISKSTSFKNKIHAGPENDRERRHAETGGRGFQLMISRLHKILRLRSFFNSFFWSPRWLVRSKAAPARQLLCSVLRTSSGSSRIVVKKPHFHPLPLFYRIAARQRKHG
jgi:hypothetical protein